MRKICEILKRKDVGSIGIGAMIVFIAMVLVAGIAASVLIQTAVKLESQAMATGSQTITEVAGGIAIVDIEAHIDTDIDALAITVAPRAGSPGIDLNESVILLSDGSSKVLLYYDYADATHFNASVDLRDGAVFGFAYDTLDTETFGILVLEDADLSCTQFNPVINQGDKVMLMVCTTECFPDLPGIDERTDVFGSIFPEHGSPGVISFRTPSSYYETIYDVQ